ncbi:hypothetical protein llap_927 [Limosa lapponica baueri]|uniref:Uncharacterized protein n=1 Tax=Limosa lapponica baueri TaxID=1758121 RepID=A0A2I0URT4_LIMLA|nr:hypothetical protein llap_927 [Limosa lapponica baueri]
MWRTGPSMGPLLLRLRNRRRRLVRVAEREESERISPPSCRREETFYQVCALGEGEEGGEGGRDQRASQRLPYPSAELPELLRGGGEGRGQHPSPLPVVR